MSSSLQQLYDANAAHIQRCRYADYWSTMLLQVRSWCGPGGTHVQVSETDLPRTATGGGGAAWQNTCLR